MSNIVHSPQIEFYGQCRICMTTFTEKIKDIVDRIVEGDKGQFAASHCPVCGSMSSVYPEDYFREKIEKRIKINPGEGQNRV